MIPRHRGAFSRGAVIKIRSQVLEWSKNMAAIFPLCVCQKERMEVGSQQGHKKTLRRQTKAWRDDVAASPIFCGT